ncbi:MAG: peptide deformylase [Bacteriovorax sp.]|jgi:peptide deformylase|nr:peptide deformylase [Bacteriovorax sp.]
MKNNFLNDYKLEGEKLEIFTFPAPVLKKVASPVLLFNDELHTLIKNMLFTMYHAPGIGLAAPQVGVSQRLFVLDIWFDREKITHADGSEEYRLSEFSPLVFINPLFKNKKGEIVHEEGCLSVPGVYEDVKRAELVTVEFQDMFGEHHELEADELLSVCLQHENDHLDGVLFIERLSFLKKQLIEKKFLKQRKKGK